MNGIDGDETNASVRFESTERGWRLTLENPAPWVTTGFCAASGLAVSQLSGFAMDSTLGAALVLGLASFCLVCGALAVRDWARTRVLLAKRGDHFVCGPLGYRRTYTRSQGLTRGIEGDARAHDRDAGQPQETLFITLDGSNRFLATRHRTAMNALQPVVDKALRT